MTTTRASAIFCIICVPTLFLLHASVKPEAMFPTVLSTFWAILSMVVSIVVPVPFVQTSTRLLPTLTASFLSPSSAVFAALIVFLPSFFHASRNGFQSFLRRSASFFAESLILSSAVSPSARLP